MPKASIIIPAYNAQNVISGAIKSILFQNFRNIEILVIDDGSTDGTRDTVKSFLSERSGKVLRYWYQENQGVSSARNLGISKASGDYICFLDGDDLLISENAISRKVKFLKDNEDVDIVFSNTEVIDVSGKSESLLLDNEIFLNFFQYAIEREQPESVIFNDKFYRKYFEFSPFPIHTSSVLMRKKILEGKEFPLDLDVGEDVYLWYALIRGRKVGYLKEALSRYQMNLSTLTKDKIAYETNNIILFKRLLSEDKNSFINNIFRKHLCDAYFELSYYRRKELKQYRQALNDAVKSLRFNAFELRKYKNLAMAMICYLFKREI